MYESDGTSIIVRNRLLSMKNVFPMALLPPVTVVREGSDIAARAVLPVMLTYVVDQISGRSIAVAMSELFEATNVGL